VLLLVELGCVVLAGRAVRYPLAPELGVMNVEVSVGIRSSQVGVPDWALPDEVRLTDREILAIVQPSPTAAFGRRIELADVVGVSARQARPQDNPWLTLEYGREYVVPAGDVVVEVRSRRGDMVLPVRDAVTFAEVIRSRIAAVRAKQVAG
jgi:hypothetical protein